MSDVKQSLLLMTNMELFLDRISPHHLKINKFKNFILMAIFFFNTCFQVRPFNIETLHDISICSFESHVKIVKFYIKKANHRINIQCTKISLALNVQCFKTRMTNLDMIYVDSLVSCINYIDRQPKRCLGGFK